MKLNIACGSNIFPFDGWENLDREDLTSYFNYIKTAPLTGMPLHQQNVANFFKNGGKTNFKTHNLLDGLSQYDDNSCDLLYLGQCIEHWNKIYETPNILKECFRIMKLKSGVLRITTPDLELLINAYNENTLDKFDNEQPDYYKNADKGSKLSYILFGSTGPNCSYKSYEGHFHIYDKTSLTLLLKEIGFTKIYFYNESGISQDPIMAKECVDFGVSHSLICEASK